jgi:CrcB protein
MKALAPYLWIGFGGFFGSIARHFVSRVCIEHLGARFPWGTFVVNISGSFVLGLLMSLIVGRAIPDSDHVRYAICIGFIGAYTTFSTFEFESHALLHDGQWLHGMANIVGSLVAGLLAVRLGISLARLYAAGL